MASEAQDYLTATLELCRALGAAAPVDAGGVTLEDATRLSMLQTDAAEAYADWGRARVPAEVREAHDAVSENLFPRKGSISAAAEECARHHQAMSQLLQPTN